MKRYGASDADIAKYQEKSLETFIGDIVRTDSVSGDRLYLRSGGDGCFARAYLLVEELRRQGYDVKYATVDGPLNRTTAIPDDRFNFHVAPVVTLKDGREVVVDPLYSRTGTIKLSDWVSRQSPITPTPIITIESFHFNSRIDSSTYGTAKVIWGIRLAWSSYRDLASKWLEAYDSSRPRRP